MKVKTHKKNQGSVRLLKVSMVWAVLLILMAVFVVVAVAIGSAGYSFTSIVQTLYRAVTGQGLTEEESTILVVVLSLRLPRVLLALLVGAALSAAGALLQAVMRNPLADPGTIGVSAGAGTAAITVLLIFPNLTLSLPLFAFGGAALALSLIHI